MDSLQRRLASTLAIEDRATRGDAVLALISETMAAHGFAKTGDGIKRDVMRAGDLAPSQRDALLTLSTYPRLRLSAYLVPGPGWAIRQWLGVDPPGVLFAPTDDGTTLYDRLRAALRRSPQESLALILALPMPQQLQVATDLLLAPHDYDFAQVAYLLGKPHYVTSQPPPPCIIDNIGSDCGEWATAIANRVLTIDEAPPLYHHEERLTASADLAGVGLPVLLALARAKIPIQRRFEPLLPAVFDRSIDPKHLHECIAAVPETRREHAIDDALASSPDAVIAVEQILPRYPYAAVARFILMHLDRTQKPKAALRAVKAAAKSSPAISAELAAFEDAIPDLQLIDRKPPRLADLDAIAQQQLAIAGAIEGKVHFTAQQILAGDVEDFDPTLIELIHTSQGGRRAYDAWIMSRDSGTIFTAGTTEVVAEIVQGGVDCADRGLRTAFVEMLATKPPVKPTPSRKSTSKSTSTSKPKSKPTSKSTSKSKPTSKSKSTSKPKSKPRKRS